MHGADPNFPSPEGWTPLHAAAERNTGTRVIKLLLRSGADPGARTADGWTALDLAERNGKKRVADYLRSIAVS